MTKKRKAELAMERRQLEQAVIRRLVLLGKAKDEDEAHRIPRREYNKQMDRAKGYIGTLRKHDGHKYAGATYEELVEAFATDPDIESIAKDVAREWQRRAEAERKLAEAERKEEERKEEERRRAKIQRRIDSRVKLDETALEHVAKAMKEFAKVNAIVDKAIEKANEEYIEKCQSLEDEYGELLPYRHPHDYPTPPDGRKEIASIGYKLRNPVLSYFREVSKIDDDMLRYTDNEDLKNSICVMRDYYLWATEDAYDEVFYKSRERIEEYGDDDDMDGFEEEWLVPPDDCIWASGLSEDEVKRESDMVVNAYCKVYFGI